MIKMLFIIRQIRRYIKGFIRNKRRIAIMLRIVRLTDLPYPTKCIMV